MDEFESPIEIAVNTRRVLMDCCHGELEIRLRNLAGDETFDVGLNLAGRLMPRGVSRKVTLGGGHSRRRRIPLDLTTSQQAGGSATGAAVFDIELDIKTQEDETHRFAGQFSLTVLAHAQTMQEVNVSIDKIVEQQDKGGMGAINELDLSNFINLPKFRTVNDFLTETGEPRFVPVELEYEGPVRAAPPAVLERDTPPLARCSLVPEDDGHRLLVITGDRITLGRGRTRADIVTWVMPRSPDNDHASRSISQEHCRLALGEDGLFVEHLSANNPTRLSGAAIQGRVKLPADGPTELQLASVLTLRLTPMPMAALPEHITAFAQGGDAALRRRWERAARTGVGGVLVERADDLPERYLWLLAAADVSTGEDDGCGMRLLAVPHVAAMPAHRGQSLQVGDETGAAETAVPLGLRDQVAAGSVVWSVQVPSQDLDPP